MRHPSDTSWLQLPQIVAHEHRQVEELKSTTPAVVVGIELTLWPRCLRRRHVLLVEWEAEVHAGVGLRRTKGGGHRAEHSGEAEVDTTSSLA